MQGSVVHLLGRADHEVVAHVAAVTRALAASGLPQAVILVDDERARALLAAFDPGVRLVLCGAPSASRTPAALLSALAEETGAGMTQAVHLHGLLPGLLGIFAAKFRALRAPLHLTLYGHGVWQRPSRWLAGALRALVPLPQAAVADGAALPSPVDVVEGALSESFFGIPRREARRPLIVAASRALDPRGAARFAQLAVLLHDASLSLGFNWVGPADAASLAQLGAAGVGQFDAPDDARRVARLHTAWVYVAGGDAAGFPVCLAEAMALGLPCVAWATPAHKALLRDGETGLLCDSADALLTRIAQLVDSPAERKRLGEAARLEALQRFHPIGQSAALLASYRAAAAELRSVPETSAESPSTTTTRLLPIDR